MSDNIYYINTDGTGLTKLSGASALEMTTSDGWIYYLEAYSGSLNRISIEGQNKQLLNSGWGYNIVVFEDWVYFIDNGQLKKIDTNGSEVMSLGDMKAFSFNIVDSWIYYSNANDNGAIYRTNIDNPQINEFLVRIDGSDTMRNMNIVGGYLFYTAYFTEHPKNGDSDSIYPTGTYMMSLDGSAHYLIWDLYW